MSGSIRSKTDLKHFGARVRELRGDRSLKEFGDLIGRSASGVRKIELNPNPTLDTLFALQRGLGFASIEELFGEFPSNSFALRSRTDPSDGFGSADMTDHN